MLIHSTRAHGFSAPPEQVWSALTSVDRYRRWWPWLTDLEADAFGPGERWRCEVRPPLRYRVRFDLLLDRVHEARAVDATIAGDIRGTAALRLGTRVDGGTDLVLESWLEPSARWLRAISVVAGPVAERGHDWVLDTGLRQFAQRGLAAGPTA